MANNISNNQTLEEFRLAYNSLVDEVGGIGTLRTSQKGSLVDAVNSIVDQFFFFQDFEYTGSNGTSSNRTFSGDDNFSNSLNYSVNRLLVFKNGVLLRSGTDYSATNGTSITLQTSAANSDIIRITSFTGSYEGTAGGAASGTVTQWTKTGGGSIYNHDTSGGVVINSDDSGIVTTPASGVGIQLESSGSDIYLNAGGSSKKVDVNANLSLRSGMKLQKAGGDIAIGDIQGLQAAVRGTLSAGTGISYNSSTGAISASGSADTTGNAATATALETARTIHGVSFNGTANIDLTEQIQDTVGALISGSGSTTVTYNDGAGTLVVSSTGKTTEEIQDIAGAMFSSNTETGITATYEDGDGTIDLVIGNDAIVSSMIADNTIVGGNIAANTIGSSEIAPNAINASELADDAVDTDAIVNNAVTLGTKTSGNYVGTVTGGTGITSSGATSGEGIAHTLSITNTGVTAQSYGSGSAIPVLAINAQGQITSASTASVNVLTQEQVEDIVGSMVDGGTETRIGVTYDDTNGRLNFVVDDMTANTTYSTATSSTEGLVKIGFTESGKNYPVELSSGQMFVNVPWTDTNTNTTNFNINANGGANENISAGEAIRFNGGGATSVSRSGNTITISSTDTNTDTNTVTSVGVSGSQNTGTITLAASGASSISQSGNTITISSTDTNTDTNTTYSAGTGLDLSGTTFSVESDLRGEVALLGQDSNNYWYSYSSTHDWVLGGTTEMRLTNAAGLHVDGNVTAYSGSINSDINLKDNVQPISNALETVDKLNGVTFNWKHDNSESMGLIAQEVQEHIPYLVSEIDNLNDDGSKLTVNYQALTGLLINAIKELKEEIQSLKS